MTAVLTFYRFVNLKDPERWRRDIEAEARRLDLCGTVLIASEGINGTLAGTRDGLEAMYQALTARPALVGLRCRYSRAAPGNPVFHRLKVRIKPEIVRLDQGAVAVARQTGEHVDARRWNELLDDPAVTVIDTRNGYEIAIGSFPGARDPGTRAFREWPDYVQGELDPARDRQIAMFCTGGIRCEKASAWLLGQGFETVYQLDGGILGYLDTVPAGENRFAGECFVFDQRVSVDEALGEGSFEQCFACRRPLSAADRESPAYHPGVSCPQCLDEHDEDRRAGFRERVHQEALAAASGRRHIGARFDPDA